MKAKTWIPLVLAVVLGLVALKLTRDAISRRGGDAKDSNFVATVTAAHDIEPGQKLTPADLATGKTPADSVPAGSFQAVTDPNLVERVAATRIVKGQTVLENLLAPVGTAAGVQSLIPEGMRLITIQVTEFSGLAGLLTPGSKVDIISVIRNDPQEGSVSRTIVQNVEVRAIGRQIVASATPPAPADNAPGAPPVPFVNNVSLIVSPEQAEAIQLASVGGTWLVLRNPNDTEPFDTLGTSLADLRGDKSKAEEAPNATALTGNVEKPEAPKQRTPRTRTVTFIRATKEEAVKVEVAPAPPAGWLNVNTDPSETTKN